MHCIFPSEVDSEVSFILINWENEYTDFFFHSVIS